YSFRSTRSGLSWWMDQSGNDAVAGCCNGVLDHLRGGGTSDGDGGDTTGGKVNLNVVDLGQRTDSLGDAADAVTAGHAGDLVDGGNSGGCVGFRGGRGGGGFHGRRREGRGCAAPTAVGDHRQQGGSRGGHRIAPSDR